MNKELLKNRKVVVSAGIVVLLLIFLGFFFINSRNSNTGQNNNILPTQIPVPTITAESIGLTLVAGKGGRTVIVTVGNIEGITAIEYELSYISKGDVPRGAIGQLDLEKNPVRAEITLGTCSDTCHYDEDVRDIKIVLKITKDDGNIYQAEKTLDSLE